MAKVRPISPFIAQTISPFIMKLRGEMNLDVKKKSLLAGIFTELENFYFNGLILYPIIHQFLLFSFLLRG